MRASSCMASSRASIIACVWLCSSCSCFPAHPTCLSEMFVHGPGASPAESKLLDMPASACADASHGLSMVLCKQSVCLKLLQLVDLGSVL